MGVMSSSRVGLGAWRANCKDVLSCCPWFERSPAVLRGNVRKFASKKIEVCGDLAGQPEDKTRELQAVARDSSNSAPV